MNIARNNLYKVLLASVSVFLLIFLLLYFIRQIYYLNYISLILFLWLGIYIKTIKKDTGVYVGYCIFIWTFTPFLRRIIDYFSSWNANSVVMLLPFLVCSLVLIDIVKRFKRYSKLKNLGVLLSILGIIYGFVVGFISFNPVSAIYDILNWIVPVLFAGYIITDTDYKEVSSNVIKSFAIISIITAIYGILQYFLAPSWDTYWLINSKLTSMGHPYPQEIRVWSTLNSAGVYAVYAMSGIILGLLMNARITIAIFLLSGAALLLSLVRTAWLGLIIALIIFLLFQRFARFAKFIIGLLAVLSFFVLIINQTKLFDNISSRISTLNNVQNDGSFADRSRTYSAQSQKALTNVFGDGLGSTGLASKLSNVNSQDLGGFDSGLLNIANSLGWFGSLTYFFGLIFSVFLSLPRSRRYSDVVVYFSLGLVFIVQLVSYSSQVGATGFLMWLFISLAISGNQSYRTKNREFKIKKVGVTL